MKRIPILLVASLFALVSCDKDEPDNEPAASNNRVINTNLDGRVQYHNEPIEPYGKRSSNNNAQWTYVAEITAPVVNGATLSATGIDFQGNKAYVSYHWNGAEGDFAGAVEVIDITHPSQPVLLSSLLFIDTDLNEIYVEGNKVYTVGGRSIYSSGYSASVTDGGIVEVIDLQAGLLTNNTAQSWLPSFSGNSVFKKGNYLYVTSGNTGGGAFKVSLKNNNYLAVEASDYYDHSKFGVNENGKFIFLQGGPSAQLFVHNSNQFNPAGKTVISLSSSTSPLDGKAVLYVDQNTAYVSGGTHGMQLFDLSSGSGVPSFVFSTGGNGFVNGVHANKDHVFIAKGHEGLYILNESDNSINALFDFPGSANYVRASSNGKNVFVANGIGGLKILAKNDPLNYGDPYCTNETVYEPYNGGNGIVRLTAMGNYKENGQYGKRWRIRNEMSQDVTVYWDIYNTGMNGSFFVPAKTSVHFTSHMTNGTGGGGTMRLFANPNFTNQLQVKAHGGSTKDLALCNGSGNQDIACADRPEMTPSVIATTYTVGNGVTQWYSSPQNGGNTLQNDIVIYGDFHYCGSMRVITNTVIQNGGLFDMEGALTIDRDLNIASGGKLIVEGALTVVGNLNFSGTIEFVGAGASVTVFGNVNRNAGAQVIGSYTGTPL